MQGTGSLHGREALESCDGISDAIEVGITYAYAISSSVQTHATRIWNCRVVFYAERVIQFQKLLPSGVSTFVWNDKNKYARTRTSFGTDLILGNMDVPSIPSPTGLPGTPPKPIWYSYQKEEVNHLEILPSV